MDIWGKVVGDRPQRLWASTVQRDRRGVPAHEESSGARRGEAAAVLAAHAEAFRAEAMLAAAQARTAADPAALEESVARAHHSAEALVDTARGLGRTLDRDAEAEEAKAQLDAVRKRAEGWRNGVSATFGLILATLAIKPGEGFMKYEGDPQVVLRILVGASVLLSLAALVLLVRAANGPGWLKELTVAEGTKARYEARAAGAYFDFWCGRWAWALSLFLFLAAVTVTWFVEPPAQP